MPIPDLNRTADGIGHSERENSLRPNRAYRNHHSRLPETR
jgi:hypothetical protein